VKRLLITCLLGVTAAACGGRPLTETRESPAAVAEAVLDAVERRDEAALRRLSLDEQEFREAVWPDLPASRPERNLSFGYVWSDLRTKSNAGLGMTLNTHGGRVYELERVAFTRTTQYDTFLVHRDAVLTVRDDAGQRQDLRLFGSIIEKDQRFKVFSYVAD
jgi:hypothetical protein